MPKILIVEDDAHLASTLQDELELERYRVEIIDNGNAAIKHLASNEHDLIILDLTLPGCHGLEVLKTFRRRGGTTPVLILTAAASIIDKESGFEAGADDYLTKPFHMQELIFRVRALLRRPPDLLSDVLKWRNVELDPNKFLVFKGGKAVRLSPTEFALLEFLMRNQGRIFSSEQLLVKVWPAGAERLPDTIRTCVRKLRAKLDEPGEPSIVDNVHGVGYRLGN